MQRSDRGHRRHFGILDTPSAIQDSPDAQGLDSCDGRIDFQNVTFRYSGTSTDAVKDLNSADRAGQKLRAWWARAAQARAPFFRSFSGSTILLQAWCESTVTICAD